MPTIQPGNTDEQQAAARIIGDFGNMAASIRADQQLSDQGRRVRLAAEYLRAKEKLDNLNAGEADRTSTRIAELQRRLFGVPATDPASVAVFRDAQDRAAKMDKPSQAQEALDRALVLGDTSMARAVALICSERGWSSPLASYAAQTGATEALDELVTLVTQANSAVGRMARSMSYSLPLPAELKPYRNSLTDLAGQADTAAA
jgi:hypothetical protein